MTSVCDLTSDDAQALTALYEDYEWWADRDVSDVREALANTEVAVADSRKTANSSPQRGS
ncbi:hypothetical protein [Natrinema salaciae]|uniref:Uncharacterized protein n=1 Tax=Natrinema salaciae TaxID=1186196 RepID=A0A1H9IN31_9EURY|nr:hypothetical protein [Natrinema salaciae]SEQ76000.1 hypothetical protein SAMN04489841_2282 [Natrinema salaciae]